MGRLRLSARIKRDMEKETRREIGGRTGVNRLVYVHVIEQPGPSAHSLGHLEIGCSRYPVTHACQLAPSVCLQGLGLLVFLNMARQVGNHLLGVKLRFFFSDQVPK
jgi:hypothetical protein